MPLVRISLIEGRPAEYRRAAGEAGLRPQGVWVNLVEVAKENW